MNFPYPMPEIPALVPVPSFCRGIDCPVISLDGTWMFLNTEDCRQAVSDDGTCFPASAWETIEVPSWVGPRHREGFCGSYVYWKRIEVTKEMASCRIILRMEGVNGFADVYVNQTHIASHKNAFVTWNTELTEAIRGLDFFDLNITVDERSDRVCTFSHGGIIHSVFLYLLPDSFINALHVTTSFDSSFQDAVLRTDFGITAGLPGLSVRTHLFDPSGQPVEEGSACLAVTGGPAAISLPVSAPLSWDAEHPRLYTIELELFQGDQLLERVCRPFGFRQITRNGNRLLVNGKEVKLHGSCRHEVTAKNGRCLTRELIEEDVRLFKEANCNYIRTSHYPPSEYFLELCDRFGIYVEDELALAFIARTLDYTQQDPAYTERYLSHFAELIARDYSHPCVIIWSLCNESFGGYNFDLLNRFAKAADPTRVTKFSYPMTIREEYEPVDIWSIHYSEYGMHLNEERDNVSVGGAYGIDGRIGTSRPVLHDEYVHVPCYNRTEQRRDPNVREYWGESIARFWNKIQNTDGALGGAIWAGIDESDVYVGGNTHLEWGIIDLWRRKKPEHYGTRKAYSPVILYGINPLTDDMASEADIHCPVRLDKDALSIGVKNCFCHTDLSETTVRGWYFCASSLTDCSIEDCEHAKPSALFSFTQTGPQLPPSCTGEIRLPLCPQADFLYLEWTDADKNQVDEFLLQENKVVPVSTSDVNPLRYTPLCLLDEQKTLTVQGDGFLCRFDKTTGLLLEISRNGIPAVTGGPRLHTPYLKLEDWALSSFSWDVSGNADAAEASSDIVRVAVSGSYGRTLDASFSFTVHSDGQIDLSYTVDAVHTPLPNQMKLRVGVDCGGLDEFGITLEAAPGTDRISWDRTGAWSVYPKDSIGRNRGTACLDTTELPFGTRPVHPWKEDARHDILNGPYDPGLRGTNDFCSTKAALQHASIDSSSKTAACWQVSPGPGCPDHSRPLHLRAEAVPDPSCVIPCTDACISYQGTWYPMHDSSYESSGYEMWSNEAGASAVCTFNGTGIVWYAPVDVNYGYARVYIDGIRQDVLINQRIDGVDFPGSAAGFDKKYHYPVYSVTGLTDGIHTLKIEVTGTHAPDSCDSYIVLENFTVLTADMRRPVLVHLLSDYNYPHISWGNCRRPPILLQKGSGSVITIRI